MPGTAARWPRSQSCGLRNSSDGGSARMERRETERRDCLLWVQSSDHLQMVARGARERTRLARANFAKRNGAPTNAHAQARATIVSVDQRKGSSSARL